MSSSVWALGRALQYAAATAVIALVASTIVSGPDAERFATTAYVAAIVAAIALAIKWFLPAASAVASPQLVSRPAFPAVFTFAIGVAAFLALGAAFVSQPSAEMLVVAACFGLIGAAALVRAGAILRLNDKLVHGNRLSAATRYAVFAAAAALAAAGVLSSQDSESLAKFAYAAIVLATMAVAASLLAPTRAGAFGRKIYGQAARLLQNPASSVIFARTAAYGASTAVVALILTSLVPQPWAERFATTAYVATVFTALGIGMKWRLRETAIEDDAFADGLQPLQFGARVAAFLILGSSLAFSAVAEALAVALCVYLIGAAIVKRAGVTSV